MKISSPLVSIVTPSFNSGDFLEQAILSVLAQDYPFIEHIVIDGGSADNTYEILNRHQASIDLISEPDEGQGDAINKGFRRARGEFVGWLNADDTYEPAAISSAVAYLQANPENDAVYGNFNFIDARGQIIYSHITPPFSLDKLLYAAIIPQGSLFFRKQVLDQVGGVSAHLHYVLDWEFTLRLAQRCRVARVDDIWGNFRIVPGTKSVGQPEKFWPEFISVLGQVARQRHSAFSPVAVQDALFMTHLLAALEYARAGKVKETKTYVEQAFVIAPKPKEHPAVLASGLYRAATYPWHSAFQPHPQARQALQNLSQCLTGAPAAKEIKAFLALQWGLKLLRQRQWSQSKIYLQESTALLTQKIFFDWRSIRMMVGATLKH